MPKVLLYDNYFETAGGGERCCLDIASAFASLGFEVELATASSASFVLEEVRGCFGLKEGESWPLRRLADEEELFRYAAAERFDVFVNHTFCSFMPNPAPLGVYMVMFPAPCPPEKRGFLSTYHCFPCCSAFSEQYVRTWWGEELPTSVLIPPISAAHFKQPPVQLREKEKLILNVGRFNVFGHNKCQLEAIKNFVRLIEDDVLDQSWRLIVAGRINPSPETEDYVGKCREAAAGANVQIRTNVSFADLCSLYRKASMLWQFTGCGLEFGVKPEHCEHLGLVSLDCFVYGTIPVVYHRGGMNQILEYGRDGFSFQDYTELRSVMEFFAPRFQGAAHLQLYQAALQKSKCFSFAAFKDKIAVLAGLGSRSPGTEELNASVEEMNDDYEKRLAEKTSVIALQAAKITDLLQINERLAFENQEAAAKLQRAAAIAGPGDLEARMREAAAWRDLGRSRLGMTVQDASQHLDVLFCHARALASPGHRMVAFMGRKLGGTYIGRGVKKFLAALIALRNA